MAQGGGGDETLDLPCCISHEFFRAASRDPDRVAAIHATGGIRVCRELRAALSSPTEIDAGELIGKHRESSSLPIYKGDVCYTYGDVLGAVETLSVRIRRILDGGEDPDVVRSEGLITEKQDQITLKSGCRLPKVVGICIAPSIEYIICVLSVLRCGEAFLPLDPLWPEERIKSLTASSNAALLVLCAPASSSIGNIVNRKFDWLSDEKHYSLFHLKVDKCLQDKQPRNTLVWPCEEKNPRLFCYVMYTSGSTGKPKGVCGSERGLVNRHNWMQGYSPLGNNDILLFKTSIIFIDHIQEFLAAMLTCSLLVIPPAYELKANPSYMLFILKVYCISRLTAVPSMMRTIIPFFQSFSVMGMKMSLKLLILSGETLSISLWKSLCHLLPRTTILNLYGSTEVSGDCLYFDCNDLLEILKVEDLTTVPIGVPISNCDVILCGEQPRPEEGELCIGGPCLFVGYLDDLYFQHDEERCSCRLNFKTGDFARCLSTGQYVFIGRKDRTLKINGQRVASEEIETVLREHPIVSDAAIVRQRTVHDTSHLTAFIVPKADENLSENISFSVGTKNANEELLLCLRKWLLCKLPLAMIPTKYIFIDILPVTPTGKIDYPDLEGFLLADQACSLSHISSNCHDHLEAIKEAFCDALLVEEITELDDFFVLGGDSMSAAQVAHTLGIDMRLLYLFPTPINLLSAIHSKAPHCSLFTDKINDRKRRKIEDVSPRDSEDQKRAVPDEEFHSYYFRDLDMDLHMSPDPKMIPNDIGIWDRLLLFPSDCIISFSRCNYMQYGTVPDAANAFRACMANISSRKNGTLKKQWKVPLFSCVDASPLLLLKDGEFYLFIGSHSQIFLCIDAMSGAVRWQVKLDGRIECSAAMTDDFSQVVIGCYMGRVYFIDFRCGMISWVFQTDGEVKMQPIACNNLIWCGSHDHFLYALDYLKRSCIFRISCGGSIFGSPSVDTEKNKLYIASTTGRVTALCIEGPSFCMAWLQEMDVPIFGTPCLDPLTGNIICCLVDGTVICLDAKSALIWKATTGGPIFAGACVSSLLPSQVLICSRNGAVYSFENGNGQLLWKYNTEEPITAAAYVDEQIELKSDPSLPPERLVCICGSSGGIHVLRVSTAPWNQSSKGRGCSKASPVKLFAKTDLPGDVFSSPVMIGGRIFVGCRDDYVHCLDVIG